MIYVNRCVYTANQDTVSTWISMTVLINVTSKVAKNFKALPMLVVSSDMSAKCIKCTTGPREPFFALFRTVNGIQGPGFRGRTISRSISVVYIHEHPCQPIRTLRSMMTSCREAHLKSSLLEPLRKLSYLRPATRTV